MAIVNIIGTVIGTVTVIVPVAVTVVVTLVGHLLAAETRQEGEVSRQRVGNRESPGLAVPSTYGSGHATFNAGATVESLRPWSLPSVSAASGGVFEDASIGRVTASADGGSTAESVKHRELRGLGTHEAVTMRAH